MTLAPRHFRYRDLSRSSLQRSPDDPSGSTTPPAAKNRTLKVDFALHEDDGTYRDLLIAMRRKAKLSIAGTARRLGIGAKSLSQYYEGKRGRGGTSTLRWFLRYAEATGCKVYLVFPTPAEAAELDDRKQVSTPPLRGLEGV